MFALLPRTRRTASTQAQYNDILLLLLLLLLLVLVLLFSPRQRKACRVKFVNKVYDCTPTITFLSLQIVARNKTAFHIWSATKSRWNSNMMCSFLLLLIIIIYVRMLCSNMYTT